LYTIARYRNLIDNITLDFAASVDMFANKAVVMVHYLESHHGY
jgi:hypothetical protein